MSQGHDVDRVKVDDYTYRVECAFCHKTFEAKRDDASFCCGAHRTAFHRRKDKMLKRLHDLDDLSTWASEIIKFFPDDQTATLLHAIARRCQNAADSL